MFDQFVHLPAFVEQASQNVTLVSTTLALCAGTCLKTVRQKVLFFTQKQQCRAETDSL